MNWVKYFKYELSPIFCHLGPGENLFFYLTTFFFLLLSFVTLIHVLFIKQTLIFSSPQIISNC